MPNHYYIYILDRDFGPSSSSSARTFRMRPSSVSTATSGSNGNSPAAGSPTSHWTTAFGRPRTPPASNRSPPSSTRPKSTRSSGSGSAACRTPSRPPTARPATVPPNRFFGLRVPSTLRNRSVWYDANALNARHLFSLGLFLVFLEFLLPRSIRIVVLRVVESIGFALVIMFDWRTANRWERERRNAGVNASDRNRALRSP